MQETLVVALALMAAPTPAVQDQSTDIIVVTGKRLSETHDALSACIARACPVQEEVRATLAHAENEFVAGDYRAARRTLRAGLSRNRRHAAREPGAVADLQRANARTAQHLGFDDSYRLGLISSMETLSRAFGREDRRTLVARVEVGDSLVAVGKYGAARDMYDSVADRATRAGDARLHGFALLRRASLDTQLAMDERRIANSRAEPESLTELLALTAPDQRIFVDAGQILRARLAAGSGNDDYVDTIIACVRTTNADTPILIHSPAIDLNQQRAAMALKGSSVIPQPSPQPARLAMEGNWADFGFWVLPDGTVSEADVLRTGSSLEGNWTPKVLQSLAGRRYLPLALPADHPGLYRVERYTHTSPMMKATGSHIVFRSPLATLARLDMTHDQTPGPISTSP